ncbi:MAG: hypothetical protein WBE92_18325, partial [Steroidobacteraceae bacterium]
MRRLYSLLAYVLAPAYCAVLLWRGVRERGYWLRFGERFGLGPSSGEGSLWMHAASAGEVQAGV